MAKVMASSDAAAAALPSSVDLPARRQGTRVDGRAGVVASQTLSLQDEPCRLTGPFTSPFASETTLRTRSTRRTQVSAMCTTSVVHAFLLTQSLHTRVRGLAPEPRSHRGSGGCRGRAARARGAGQHRAFQSRGARVDVSTFFCRCPRRPIPDPATPRRYGRVDPRPQQPSYSREELERMRKAEDRDKLLPLASAQDKAWAEISVPQGLGSESAPSAGHPAAIKWRQTQSHVEVSMSVYVCLPGCNASWASSSAEIRPAPPSSQTSLCSCMRRFSFCSPLTSPRFRSHRAPFRSGPGVTTSYRASCGGRSRQRRAPGPSGCAANMLLARGIPARSVA